MSGAGTIRDMTAAHLFSISLWKTGKRLNAIFKPGLWPREIQSFPAPSCIIRSEESAVIGGVDDAWFASMLRVGSTIPKKPAVKTVVELNRDRERGRWNPRRRTEWTALPASGRRPGPSKMSGRRLPQLSPASPSRRRRSGIQRAVVRRGPPVGGSRVRRLVKHESITLRLVKINPGISLVDPGHNSFMALYPTCPKPLEELIQFRDRLRSPKRHDFRPCCTPAEPVR